MKKLLAVLIASMFAATGAFAASHMKAADDKMEKKEAKADAKMEKKEAKADKKEAKAEAKAEKKEAKADAKMEKDKK